MKGKILCVTGTDTDIGKTIATGLLARSAMARNIRVTTCKLVQTGCNKISDDILVHRKIMGIGQTKEDRQGLTYPYLFSKPCSPHLAAGIEGQEIDTGVLKQSLNRLAENFELVIAEGAGGLYVPLNNKLFLIDFLAELGAEIILVTSNKVGSINHTLLSLDAIVKYQLPLKGLIYNRFYQVPDQVADDTKKQLEKALAARDLPGLIGEIGGDVSYKTENKLEISKIESLLEIP
ncbi:MAG: dethiobiotin synthase [Deltaproteobacteria bacterium]|nr:MAG: dethiobiotin synthase [Deltaproteobacteria bacterium]